MQNMKRTCNLWHNRSLSLKGKVTVYNTLIVSLLQYVIANTHTPTRVCEEVKEIAREFLWSGRRSKIAYNLLLQSIQEGGLKLLDLGERVTVSLLAWARRIILFPDGTAGNMIRVFTGELNDVLIWASKRNFADSLTLTSPFYSEVLRMWNRFHDFDPKGELEIRDEIIWNNPRIPSLAEKRSRPRWDRWIDAGVLTIGHLCHPDLGRLRGQHELEEAFPITPTFLEALSIRNYIPITWKRAITQTVKSKDSITYEIKIDEKKFDIRNSSTKQWYTAIIQGKKQEIKRQDSWRTELASLGEDAPIEWENVYSLPYKITRETKLQSFQYRILHRLITCKKYLHTIRMQEDDTCDLCGEQDSITHFFILCPAVHDFWTNLSDWCQTYLDLRLTALTKTEKILGILDTQGNSTRFKQINWILLTAKFYLHRQKLFHGGELSLIAFLLETKNRLIAEKIICSHEGRTNKFKTWEKMLGVLSP